ncbi:hypothetical protein ACLOJK_001703 [Asimina triloba]
MRPVLVAVGSCGTAQSSNCEGAPYPENFHNRPLCHELSPPADVNGKRERAPRRGRHTKRPLDPSLFLSPFRPFINHASVTGSIFLQFQISLPSLLTSLPDLRGMETVNVQSTQSLRIVPTPNFWQEVPSHPPDLSLLRPLMALSDPTTIQGAIFHKPPAPALPLPLPIFSIASASLCCQSSSTPGATRSTVLPLAAFDLLPGLRLDGDLQLGAVVHHVLKGSHREASSSIHIATPVAAGFAFVADIHILELVLIDFVLVTLPTEDGSSSATIVRTFTMKKHAEELMQTWPLELVMWCGSVQMTE